MDGVFPGRPKSFRHQRRPVDDCSPVRGGIVEDIGTRGEVFHGEMDRCRESYRDGLRHEMVCPNVTGRTNERMAQSKQARAGSLALVDKLPVARTCILRVFSLQIPLRFFFVLRLFLFCFGFVFISSLKPRPFV